MKMVEVKDICTAYLEGYFYAKITEHFIIDGFWLVKNRLYVRCCLWW